jgi:hypothetical protein
MHALSIKTNGRMKECSLYLVIDCVDMAFHGAGSEATCAASTRSTGRMGLWGWICNSRIWNGATPPVAFASTPLAEAGRVTLHPELGPGSLKIVGARSIGSARVVYWFNHNWCYFCRSPHRRSLWFHRLRPRASACICL